MTTNEVMDAALRVYQRLGLTLLRLTVVPSLLCWAAIAFVFAYVLPKLGSTQDSSSFAVQAGEVLFALVLAVVVGGPVFLAGLTYATAIVVRLVADWVDGTPMDEGAAMDAARTILPRLFWVNFRMLLMSMSGILFATLVLLGGGLIASVTPDSNASAGIVAIIGIGGLMGGVIIFLVVVSRDSLAAPVAVLEGKAGGEAAKRSRALLQRSGIHSNGSSILMNLYFLLALVAIALFIGVQAFMQLIGVEGWTEAALTGSPLMPLVTNALAMIAPLLVIWVLLPIWGVTLTLIYIERRIRLEGYDIETLARQAQLGGHANSFDV